MIKTVPQIALALTDDLAEHRNKTVKPRTGQRGDLHSMCGIGIRRLDRTCGAHIAFVQRIEDRLVTGAELVDQLLGHSKLCIAFRVGEVQHDQNDIGIQHFLERRAECADQMVRQIADKADRVRQKNFRAVGQFKLSCGRVKRCKQLVLG